MFKFVTNSTRHQVSFPTVTEDQAIDGLRAFFALSPTICWDYETTGLDPLGGSLLLTSLYNGEEVYVIDNTTVDLARLLAKAKVIPENYLVVAHNAKFEYNWSKVNGVWIPNIYCTMVAEQRITQGSGVSASLVETLKRRGIPLPAGMDKEVRNTFIGANPETIVFTDDQIEYSGSDVLQLLELKKRQDLFIERFHLNFLIYDIEMPLVKILGDIELDGFKHDSEKWIAYSKLKQVEADAISLQMNDYLDTANIDAWTINEKNVEVAESRDKKLEKLRLRLEKCTAQVAKYEAKGGKSLETKAYKVSKECLEKVTCELAELEAVVITMKSDVNWGSSQQVLEVFRRLKMPLPEERDKVTKKMKPSCGKEARALWLATNPTHDKLSFFLLYDKYKKLLHNINAFGEQWVVNYVHPKTGKVHTHFKQCDTDTGRLASGDASNGRYNSQQIPAIKDLRQCFIADSDDYEITTCDLSGAELIIMCSHADDEKLYELGVVTDDIHSPIATEFWRAIYAYREARNMDMSITDSKGKKYTLTPDFIVSKDINKQIRTDAKPMTFGTVYGMHDTKAAATVRVTKAEGAIIIAIIKNKFPKTFAMVEAASRSAFSKGYLITNERTNSRKWFLSALEIIKKLPYNPEDGDLTDMVKELMPFREASMIDGAARNLRIQGTQADMVKEAMVEIDNFIRANKLDCKCKGQVHDELIYQSPKGLTITCPYKGDEVKFGEYISRAMSIVSTRYLQGNYTMKADYHTERSWTK